MEYKFSEKVQTLKPSAIRELFKLMVGDGIVALSGGNPAKEAFPEKEIAEITQKILTENPIAALQYSISEGYTPLREQIAEYVKTNFNIGTEEDAVLITSGAQQANDMAVKIFCDEGDAIACDETIFIGSLSAIKANNVKLVGVKGDDSGMLPEQLEEAIATNPIKAVYLIPNFSNPTGLTMPLERRKAIYEVCKKHDIIIIEDNPYGELRFRGEHVPAFKSFDDAGIVCYSGSFSKVVAPGLRVGFMIANKKIIERGTLLKQFTDVHTNILAQMIVYEYYKNYDIKKHIAEVSAFYAKKSEYMCKLIREKLPKEIKCIEPDGGMFVWCTDTSGKIDIDELVQKLVSEKKVAIISGDVFITNNSKSHSFRLNFTVPSMEQIEYGITSIGEVLNELYAK